MGELSLNPLVEQEPIVRWLSSPQAYDDSLEHVEHVEHLETHISHVFLAGPLVYKLKKPVKFFFLDFLTLTARESACREEVRLNRRLAAEWYQGVAAIHRDDAGQLHIDGTGRVVDWLVVMRRLPTDLTMDALCQRGELRNEHIDRLADRLVAFHQSLEPLPMTANLYIDRCHVHVHGNLQELDKPAHALPYAMVKRVHGFQLQLVLLYRTLLEERARHGHIVEGHGDLRPEHVCFTDPIAIFDCIEFSAELRAIDVADELAFLAAECDFLNVEWVGSRLLTSYQAKSRDRAPTVLLDFYKSYRACVRAKVAILRAAQLEGAEHAAAAEEALRHLMIADRAAQPYVSPLFIVVGGASGTGKSTLGAALANVFGAQLLRTDAIRLDLFGSLPHASKPDQGVYEVEARARVYQVMLERAAALVDEGISVVLDGTFAVVDQLIDAQRFAIQRELMFVAIECVCRPAVAYARISSRTAEGHDPSDAWPDLHRLQRRHWQSWPQDINQIHVDTEQPVASQTREVVERLRAQASDLTYPKCNPSLSR